MYFKSENQRENHHKRNASKKTPQKQSLKNQENYQLDQQSSICTAKQKHVEQHITAMSDKLKFSTLGRKL